MKTQFVILPMPECPPEIGIVLRMLEDARRRTRKQMTKLPQAIVDWRGGPSQHSIGTLLYHIAAIEMSWLAEEVAENSFPDEVWKHFPYDVRDADGRLTPVTGEPLDAHWERLDYVRGLLLETYRAMSLTDYRRVRQFEDYDVTPEWVLHHLMQHEAEHRGELFTLRDLARSAV